MTLELHHHLCQEWAYDLNEDEPKDVSIRSGKRRYWRCIKCSYEWKCKIIDRTYKQNGCPSCAGKIVSDFNRLSKRFPLMSILIVSLTDHY